MEVLLSIVVGFKVYVEIQEVKVNVKVNFQLKEPPTEFFLNF